MAELQPDSNPKEALRISHNVSIDCEEFALNYLDRANELRDSNYYDKKKLQEDLERLKKEMKEFFELEKAAKSSKDYSRLYQRYFNRSRPAVR